MAVTPPCLPFHTQGEITHSEKHSLNWALWLCNTCPSERGGERERERERGVEASCVYTYSVYSLLLLMCIYSYQHYIL